MIVLLMPTKEDPLAVENAKENIELNKLSNRIHLFCESVHSVKLVVVIL